MSVKGLEITMHEFNSEITGMAMYVGSHYGCTACSNSHHSKIAQLEMDTMLLPVPYCRTSFIIAAFMSVVIGMRPVPTRTY